MTNSAFLAKYPRLLFYQHGQRIIQRPLKIVHLHLRLGGGGGGGTQPETEEWLRRLSAQTEHVECENMELYLDLHSQPCRSVYILAKKTSIPFTFKLVDLSAGQQHGQDFGQVSMVRKVPVMKDGNFILTESLAILQYMVEKFPLLVPDNWYPSDLQRRARVNEFLSWQHTALRAHGSKVFWFRAVVPVVTGTVVPKEKMDSALEDLREALDLFQNKFLQDRSFIAGEELSLADLVAIVEIMQPVGTGLDVFEGRPALRVWKERVKKEIGEELFDEAHQCIMNVDSLANTFKDNGMLEFLKPRIQKMFT